jgi:hypothetical protein
MSRNLELKIRIEMSESDAPVSGDSETPEAIGVGQFRLVLDGDKSLDIDALEAGLLRTSYPAIRHALGQHLSDEVKKIPNSNASCSRHGSCGASKPLSS